MMRKIWIAVPAVALVLCSCGKQEQAVPTGAGASLKVSIDRGLLAAFAPLPEAMESEANPMTPEKVELGRMLYFDTRLSKNHDISCNTCHLLNEYGVDGKPTSAGHKGALGTRNSPTVYNAAQHVAQFWDGREPTVEAQAKGPVLNPVEMAMPDEAHVLRTLNSIPGYVEAFQLAFPGQDDPITYDNFALAVGAFERGLVTPDRWDAFLQGDDAAMTDAEKAGFQTFMSAGCIACHMGPYLGGQLFQKLGLVKAWPELNDLGRFDATGNEVDKHYFKVPSLRNIAETGPYLHDGSITDMKQMIQMMAEYQSGQTLEEEKIDSLVAFMHALTGELPTEYIQEPVLPESGPDTPAPDPS